MIIHISLGAKNTSQSGVGGKKGLFFYARKQYRYPWVGRVLFSDAEGKTEINRGP